MFLILNQAPPNYSGSTSQILPNDSISTWHHLCPPPAHPAHPHPRHTLQAQIHIRLRFRHNRKKIMFLDLNKYLFMFLKPASVVEIVGRLKLLESVLPMVPEWPGLVAALVTWPPLHTGLVAPLVTWPPLHTTGWWCSAMVCTVHCTLGVVVSRHEWLSVVALSVVGGTDILTRIYLGKGSRKKTCFLSTFCG